ncbi:MAG: ribonuclease HI [Clostridia bacterium]|nr:ribonuclease HI [Clostridia bacterium]
MKQVIIYTDGACSGNPGPGGWGAILIYKEKKLELSGYEAHTTNNRMELLAPIEALSRLKEPCAVDVYSDSAYLVNAFRQRWLENWQRNGWRKSDKKPVENQDLWQELLKYVEIHAITWHKVKGHADNPLNNRCDELATGEIKQHYIKL